MGERYCKVSDVERKLKAFCKEYSISYGDSLGGFGDRLANLPSELPKEEVEPVVLGVWLVDEKKNEVVCSVCGNRSKTMSNYCPECGARLMDK